ncbi:MAG: 30S ribosomal protein S9 [Phycisphaeraceae bacterium]|nr:30S ribosomal protein S9 [Phycisphaeraceae bacterium]
MTPATTLDSATATPATQSAPRRPLRDARWWWGVGRRKTAVARVRVRPGSGNITVNGKPYDRFFCVERDRKDILNVLETAKMSTAVDVEVNVDGGGTTGQAGAIVLGLARALNNYDASLIGTLRDHHLLTRDPRKVERKKYGQAGARRRFQFSKR